MIDLKQFIDTPGMRELGIWDQNDGIGDAVSDVFADIEEHLGTCRFSDCKHESEPGCAITTAIKNGEIAQERWDSYLKLKREALYAENKLKAMREKSARNQDIAIWSRQRRKKIW